MTGNLERKKLGIQLEPPALLLLYAEGGLHKKRVMPIRDLSREADCHQLAIRMAARHQAHLGPLNIIRIEKMIRIVQEHLRGVAVSESLIKLRDEFCINPAEDLNKLSDRELRRRKAIMDLSFQKNRLDRDHPDFVYDKEINFIGPKKATDWDSSESQQNSGESTPVNSPIRQPKPLLPADRKGLFGLEEEDEVQQQPPVQPAGGTSTPTTSSKQQQYKEEEEGERSLSCGEPVGDTDSDFW